MSKSKNRQNALEERLRRSAPALRAPDRARVDKACAAAESAAPLSPLRPPHSSLKPLLSAAACLALMLGILLLTHPGRQTPALQPLSDFSSLTDVKQLIVPQNLRNPLTGEAEDLASDLTDLTAVLNERTFAILF